MSTITDKKITDGQRDAVWVQHQQDRLTGTPQQNKAVFDEYSELIREHFNEAMDVLNERISTNDSDIEQLKETDAGAAATSARESAESASESAQATQDMLGRVISISNKIYTKSWDVEQEQDEFVFTAEGYTYNESDTYEVFVNGLKLSESEYTRNEDSVVLGSSISAGNTVEIIVTTNLKGKGIAATELNDDYTLTINYDDGTSMTTESIRGEKGEKGDKGDGVYDDTQVKTDIAALDARVDTFTHLAEGSTTGDAELIDARIGYNGTTYANAGDAVRGQVSDLKSDLSTVVDVRHYQPSFDSFITVASNIRGGGVTNGSFVGTLKSVKAKLKCTSATTATVYLFEKYVVSGVNYYKLYDSFTITVPVCDATVLTFKNGTDYTYDTPIKENTYVAIGGSLNTYYYTDGTKGLSFGASVDPDAAYRAIDIESNYNISIGFEVMTTALTEIDARLDALEEPKKKYFSNIPDFSVLTSQASMANLRIGADCVLESGDLHSITLKASAAGSADIYFMVLDSNKFRVIGTTSITVKSGTNEYINGIDFNYADALPAVCFIGIIGDGSFNGYYGTNGKISFAEPNVSSLNVGDLVTMYVASYDIAIGFTVSKQESVINEETEKRLRLMQPNRTPQLESTYRHFADIDTISCVVSSTALTGKLNLIRSGTRDIANGGGAFIDFANGKMGFYKAISTASDTLTVYSEQTIGITLVSGRKYAVLYKKVLEGFSLEIVDSVTFESSTMDITANAVIGDGFGYVSHNESSDINVITFAHFTDQPSAPKALIIGDSWTAGNTMNGNRANRWCSLYNAEINGNAFIYAEGGAALANGLQWMPALIDIVAPAYVIIEFGINQGNLDIYKTEIANILYFVKNVMGAIPVLVKIPPTNGASSSIYSQINSYVENSGELYIDMCTPLTVDGDGTTRNSSLFFADGTHPNADGHMAIFNEMKCSNPQLF